MIYTDLTQLIGETPMLEIAPVEGQHAKIVAKLECFNPGGSVKDRTALAMILDAESNGTLKAGGTIIEPTSGNTGVGLAWIGKLRGYRTILTMPDTMSLERRKLLGAYGAQIVLTPGKDGMTGAIAKAEELRDSIQGAVILGQFTNMSNPKIHETTTAVEIWKQTDGKVDIFVAGMGTGGTVSGTGMGLKKFNSNIQVVAFEPDSSPLLTRGTSGPHAIQGIGANFVPDTYIKEAIDMVMTVTDKDALSATAFLAHERGLLVGISSGAAYSAARELAMKPENKGKTIVVLLPDTGERYLSTGVFD
ncbi:MAG: cysteine synthase A [Bacteroidaceae bacterium]|nr:cysteine synthase A [Bacteroidaceae bacterium]